MQLASQQGHLSMILFILPKSSLPSWTHGYLAFPWTSLWWGVPVAFEDSSVWQKVHLKKKHTHTHKACSLLIWPCLLAWVTLVPQPGVEITDSTSEAWSLNHWTARKVPLESWCWDEILLSAISTLCAWFWPDLPRITLNSILRLL